MKVLFFSSDEYTEEFFNTANQAFEYQFKFTKVRLNELTVLLAKNYSIISCSIHDEINNAVLNALHDIGVKCVALRSVGYDNVDIKTAAKLGITIAYVPIYSPYSVAEHATALILTLNRKTHKAYVRVREGNFSLYGLLGFDLHGTTVGVIGTGRIGTAFAKIMHGFGCKILAYDKVENKECKKIGVEYVKLENLFSQSLIISLHCPLLPDTRHIINAKTLTLMQRGVMLINTSRGALIDTQAVIQALKVGKIGYLGIDVYEAEKDLFFNDLSLQIIDDDIFSRLQTFPNVIITSHQGFLTKQAYTDIANATLQNITCFFTKKGVFYEVK